MMPFKATILASNDVRFSQLLLDSIKLDDGFTYLFSSSPLTSPERSLPPSAASSPPSTPPASTFSTQLLAFPNEEDVPPQSMPPTQFGPPSHSTHAKRQGHANRKQRRKREREAAKLEMRQRISPYNVRPATVRKHVKPATAYETQFNSSTIPIASSGYVAAPGKRSSSTFSLELLVGPQSRYKMRKVVWDGK